MTLLRAGGTAALYSCALALPLGAQDVGDPALLPPQVYTLDPAHSSVTFRVNHLGFSMFTAQFDQLEATLDLDIQAPEAARLTATIAAASLDLPAPPDGFRDTILGPTWFDADGHPQIEFSSTAIQLTGPETAAVTGALTIAGQTHPVTLDVTFNGGYAHPPWEPVARLGFSATGSLARSDFGMTFGIPAPGSALGVGDRVEIAIEAEFIGPKAE